MKLKIFHQNVWEDYLYWLEQDRKTIKRINLLIKDIERSPYEGVGKPEAPKHNLTGWWSRRITDEHRIVYRVQGEELHIASLRYHYEKQHSRLFLIEAHLEHLRPEFPGQEKRPGFSVVGNPV